MSIEVDEITQQKAEAFSFLLNTVCSIRKLEADKELIDHCVRIICQSGQWHICRAWFPDAKEEALVCQEQKCCAKLSCDNSQQESLKTHLKVGEDLPGCVWQAGVPVWITNVCENTNAAGVLLVPKGELTTTFAFPISFKDRRLGVLEFVSYSPKPANVALLGAAEILGTYLGLVLEHKQIATTYLQAAALARSNAELAQFASVAAHELQEPLRTIGTFSKYLSEECRGQCGKNAHEFLRMILDASSRMRHLVYDLLSYARIDTAGQVLEPTDATTCVEEAVASLMQTIKDNQACILYDSLPHVMSDHAQLTEVFTNLFSNAIKFRRDDPPCIAVAAERAGSGWLFSVKDNGIGIDVAHKDTIFEMFRRLNPASKYPGTGVGLAVCKKVVALSGGRIWVESAPDSGSTFFFTLPAVDAGIDAG